MATYKILTLDEPQLRKKAKRVTRFDGELKALVDDMLETMHAASGLGLAAPQIGIAERVVVIQLPDDFEDEGAGKQFTLINPEIVSRSDEEAAAEEMCLSIPGFIGEVGRSLKVRVRAQNLKGKTMRLDAEGFLARVFQHEIDHLDGVLFIDRVTDPAKLRRITSEGTEHPIQAPA